MKNGNTITLYREVCRSELECILQVGLQPTLPCYKPREIFQEMELLDRFRPAHIIDQGIERMKAIFATHTPNTPNLSFRDEHIVISFEVDVSKAWVGDMHFITCLIPFIDAHREGLEQFSGAFRKYWDSVIPFGEFYEQQELFFVPEVLVMDTHIDPKKIKVVESKVADVCGA